MREIKFRLWDNQTNKFFGDGYSISQDGTEVYDDNWSEMNDVELSQFTGLLDKNGTEIYEGDLLSEKHSYQNKPIEFIDGGFWIVLDDKYLPNTNYCEIVGNIWENSELLN